MLKIKRWKNIYVLFIAIIYTVVLSIASFQYTNYVDRKNKQQWCETFGTFNIAYKVNPPTTDTGKALAREFARMYSDFGCK